MVSTPLKTLSLFSGCGGLDLGVEGGFSVHASSAGKGNASRASGSDSGSSWVTLPKTPFTITWANDLMPHAKHVWEQNFTQGHYELNPLEQLLAQDYAFPQADLVVGGFPCQDFSVAGKRRGFASTRGTLYQAMAQVLRRVKPKAFIAENVWGLLSIAGAVETITEAFEAEGYQVGVYPLLAQDYGVPQTRQRLFFVGLRQECLKRDVLPEELHPPKTHASPVTLRTILADLPEPDQSHEQEQRQYSKAKWYGQGRQGNVEVNLDKPGPTIRAEHHGNIEFRRLSQAHGGVQQQELSQGFTERRLTVRECARIQTFPDNFCFLKTKAGKPLVSASAAYRVIGNAVPPLLGYRVAERLASLWDDIFYAV
jgi:DNA (cytosine-5)-methyltransferase 1